MKKDIILTHTSLLAAIVLMVAGVLTLGACNDEETYADQVKRERSAIGAYVADSAVNVISEAQFRAQGDSTDVSRNQFVLFESSGLYMQIVRKGSGKPLASGETGRVICRYTERNLLTDSIQASNTMYPIFYRFTETMNVTNNSGTFEGSFDSSTSLMYYLYGSTSVPSGWLAALPYLNLGRYEREGDEVAKVRLIVPHDLGQTYAIQNVYPCLYDITFERGL